MAFTSEGESLSISFPITKATEAEDGSIYVEGLCTDDGIDLDDQIIDADFAHKGLVDWFTTYANVRQMHSSNLAPAGKAVDMEKRAEGIWIRTRVVEPTAVKLVKEGVYQAYSVGISKPRIIRDGIAKNGRVVDGVFSEISLVDFPANPRSRFELAKRAKSGELEIVEKTFEADLTKAAPTPAEVFGTVEKTQTEKGPDFVAEQPEAEKSADADVTPVEAEVTKDGSRDCPKCGETYHADSKVKFCGDCGAKLPGNAEKSEDADVSKALADHKEPDGDEDGPDVDGDGDGKDDADNEDDAAASKSAVPLFTRRLHDATCAAFHEEDVLEAHPVAAKGIPSLIDPAPWAEAVTKALTEDAGTGSRMDELPALSEAYGLAVSLKSADAGVLDEAMDGLRKSFADAFPGAHPTPGALTPGQFKRPYISAGRTAPTAKPGQHPRIPLSSHVPDASDFTRGADPDLTKRTYYTNAAKEHASSTLTAMHDYIAGQHPGVCPMGTEPIEAAAASEKALDVRADSVPTPVTPEAPTDVTKGFDPEVMKASVRTQIEAMRGELRNELRDELSKSWEEEREALKKRVSDLEEAPDPNDRAYRGGPLAALRPTKAVESAAGSADAGTVEVLKSNILKARRNPSGPEFDALMKALGPVKAAELVAD